MFGKLASDALGISDIGRIIPPKDFNKVDCDDYIMHEKGEKIYFLIKSKTDEYCFTNLAFLHLDGESAMSKKRLLKRYDYLNYDFSRVYLETAGTIDLDVEIKFTLGGQDFSIDVHKDDIEHLKDIYKTLMEMSAIMAEEKRNYNTVEKSLQLVTESIGRHTATTNLLADDARGLYSFYYNTLKDAKEAANRRDYGEIFELFIKN
ncbi:MAG: PH domain-containing protein [Bacilli bacterium]